VVWGKVKFNLLVNLTTDFIVVIIYNMKAELIFQHRGHDDAGHLFEMVIWRVPQPVVPCLHPYKYRLVYIVDGQRVVGYDNERGKGDHKHINGEQFPYLFKDVRTLMRDFQADIARWKNGYRHS